MEALDLEVDLCTHFPIFVYKRRGKWHGVCREMGVHATATTMRDASFKAGFISMKLQSILIDRHCPGIFWPNEFSIKWAALIKRGVDCDIFDAILLGS